MRVFARRRGMDEQPEAPADELTAELAASYWEAHDKRVGGPFRAVARQLPGLVGKAVRLGWEANRGDTIATIMLNLVSGIFTGFALLATTGVLEALFAAGPTPQRVRAALPSLFWSPWPWRRGRGCRPRRAGRSPGSIRRWTGWWRSGCLT